MKLSTMIRFGYSALQFKITNKPRPINVMISVTDRCTGRCRYCGIPSRNSKEMETSEILRLIDEMAEAGTLRLGIWGGEPLLRNDINEIVLRAKQNNFFVTMDTNGHLLPQKPDVIRMLDHVIIGYDGPKEAHEINRGQGTHNLALDAIRVACPITRVWTITVLTKANVGSIDDILETARSEGFLATFQVLHHNDALAGDCPELVPSNEELRLAFNKLIKAKKSGAPIASSLNYLNTLYRWPDYARHTTNELLSGRQCLAGKLYCNVDTDGKVYPCSLLINKMPASDANRIGFKAAFETLGPYDCKSCVASCFIEYNHLFSLHPSTVLSWAFGIRKGGYAGD